MGTKRTAGGRRSKVDHTDALPTLQTFDTGATRIPVTEHAHYICPELELRIALICAEGFDSYPDKDIEYAELSTGRRGLTKANLAKHCRRHWLLYWKGDTTEDHLAKVSWALMMIAHFECDPPCQHFNMLLEQKDQLNETPKGFGKEKGTKK